jgi:hypothetical protein
MYELHIGLPKSATTLRQALLERSPHLKVAQAGASSTEPVGQSLQYQAHDVGDGGLDTLLTCRTASMRSLVESADLAVRLSAPNVNVRVEGEKILFKGTVGDSSFERFEPIENVQFNFDGVRTLPIPPFEAHLAITWRHESDGEASPVGAAQIAETIGYAFHQSTEFPKKDKVVLTTFHSTACGMETSVRALLQLVPPVHGIQLVVSAEQVLFCIAPRGERS